MKNPFSHLDDYELMKLYKNGEPMAFEAIYFRHKDRVYTYLNKRLNDKNLIDDLFQNIFIKFHKSRHLYNDKFPLLKWIYTICRSELLDSFKKNKVQYVELNETQLEPSFQEQEENLELDSERTLSKKEREALKLRYYSDEDFLEISKLLKTSESNSRKLVSRGLKKLRDKFKGR